MKSIYPCDSMMSPFLAQTELHLLDLMAKSALTGLRNIIPTIMIGKIEIELPAMYIMNRFIGICLNGPSAMSQDF